MAQSPCSSSASLLPIAEHYAYVDPPHYLRCVICTDVMRHPVSLPCGHSFCAACCQQSLERKRECPCCRKEVLAGPHPNLSLCQALDEQLVHCIFGPRRKDFTAAPVFELDPQGCTSVLKRGAFPSHEQECPFRWVVCDLLDPLTDERCPCICRYNELGEHHRQCDFMPLQCPNEGCLEQVCARSLARHKGHCMVEVVKCPNKGCTQMLTRRAMRAHQEQCAFRVVLCMFHKYGCVAKGSVKAMDDHMKSSASEHMLLLCNILEYQQHRFDHEKRVSCPHKEFKCIISNFVSLAKKQVIDIDLDCSWKLKIWPNGEDKRHKGYVSIRLFSREASPNFKVEGPYTLRIVNHLDRSRSIVKMTEALSREWADSIRGWGFPAFAKVEDVVNPQTGFLKEDDLVVEVEVTVNSAVEIVEFHDPDP
eukprot:EG_transcript_10764